MRTRRRVGFPRPCREWRKAILSHMEGVTTIFAILLYFSNLNIHEQKWDLLVQCWMQSCTWSPFRDISQQLPTITIAHVGARSHRSPTFIRPSDKLGCSCIGKQFCGGFYKYVSFPLSQASRNESTCQQSWNACLCGRRVRPPPYHGDSEVDL